MLARLWRGWSNRIGWYEGFHLLLCVNPLGVITGFGFGAASSQSSLILGTDTDYVPGFSSTYRKFHIGLTTSTHDQQLASTLFAARQTPSSRLPSAVLPAHGSYVADKGFAGERPRQRWQ